MSRSSTGCFGKGLSYAKIHQECGQGKTPSLENLLEYSKRLAFPKIFVKGSFVGFVGGYDILHETRESGELEKLLQ